jgi:hypothetical protein
MGCITPIVLIIFNRPESTRQVFAAIRAARPQQLLVIADAPRAHRPDDIPKCAAARAIVEEIDWNCQVFKNYADHNLGCGLRVSSGLDWVFQQVETAIILEDDCLPDQTFFPYCTALLDHYQHDPRIVHISGNNFQFGQQRGDASYFYSCYPHMWGWATWRRAWQHYRYHITSWPDRRSTDWLEARLDTAAAVANWRQIFDQIYNREIDTWDYQWTFACWQNNGLCIHPQVDLVANIGFNNEGTHTVRQNQFANLPLGQMQFPLTHPPTIIRDRRADMFVQSSKFNLDLWSRLQRKLYWHRFVQKVRSFFHRA